jgi:hypothetical protein
VCFPVATARAVSAAELRWAPLRDLSVPLLLAWASELQLDAGMEGLFGLVNNGPVGALSATAGVTVIADVLGADPSEIGLTAGWPLWWESLPLEPSAVPTFYLRFSQAF